MAEERSNAGDDPREPRNEVVLQRPRRAWERPTVENEVRADVRETFRRDAPSPGQEILAEHDANLREEVGTGEDPDEQPAEVFCF